MCFMRWTGVTPNAYFRISEPEATPRPKSLLGPVDANALPRRRASSTLPAYDGLPATHAFEHLDAAFDASPRVTRTRRSRPSST